MEVCCNMNGKVSVIIPVYNAEKVIERTVNSLLSQSYSDFEIILVDDGSKDKSGRLCDELAQKDSRVKVIHQENMGAAEARNTGLKNVAGEWLMFVDSDDTLVSDAMEKLVKRMSDTKADLCIYGWTAVSASGDKTYSFDEESTSTDPEYVYCEITKSLYNCGGGYPWNKFWRVSSIKHDGKICEFDKKLWVFEDKLWILKSIDINVKKVTYEPSCLYKYYIGDNTLSHNKDKEIKRYYHSCEAAETIYDYIIKEHKTAEPAGKSLKCERYLFYLMKKLKSGQPIEERDYDVYRKLKNVISLPTDFKTMTKYSYICMKFLTYKK